MENKIDCGGAYIKVMGKIFKTPLEAKRLIRSCLGQIFVVQLEELIIFTYKDTNYLINNDIRTETDGFKSSLYFTFES